MISRRGVAFVCGTGLFLAACGDDAPEGASDGPLSEAEFVAQADQICIATFARFGELEDPDGPGGGAKPIGIGGFIRDWVSQLRALEAPVAVADDWETGLDLLDESADKLDQAEAGDTDAQGEALFGLQAEAQEHFNAMKVPFKACFVEPEQE